MKNGTWDTQQNFKKPHPTSKQFVKRVNALLIFICLGTYGT